MPTYNQLRAAYGLPTKTTFRAITGEASEAFPTDPLLTPGNEVNDPNSLDFTALFDINGNPVDPASPDAQNIVTRAVRRTPVAARLKAVYGSVNNVDAFVGMVAEPHVAGTEFGELQLAIWKEQFQASRDGDRFFYLNDPLQSYIRQNFGIDSRRTLAQVIAANTDIPLAELPARLTILWWWPLTTRTMANGTRRTIPKSRKNPKNNFPPCFVKFTGKKSRHAAARLPLSPPDTTRVTWTPCCARRKPL